MSKSGFLDNIRKALSNVGIKAPWKYTGPASSPEYLTHLPKATEYRIHAPGSSPIKPFIPQADDDKIYDIKYYTRDTRRAYLPGGTKTITTSELDPRNLEDLPAPKVDLSDRFKWQRKLRSMLDTPNNGYQ